MKIKHLLLIICLLCSGIVSAQSNKLFEKYAGEDDVTVINISKSMIKMMKGGVNSYVNISKIIDKIENMRIITSDKNEMKEKMYVDFKATIAKDRGYEELMTMKDGKSKISFNAKKDGDLINELIMLVNDEENFVGIQILGNFTLKDIQSIMAMANVQ